MSVLTWAEAVTALLTALGRAPAATAPSLNDLPEALRGSGLGVSYSALIDGQAPGMHQQLGCLLQYDENQWVAVLGSVENGQLLQANGVVLRPMQSADWEQATHAAVVTEALVSLASMAPFIKRYKGKLLEIFLCGLLINLFALTLPLFSSFVYDKILGNGITATLWALVIGLALLVVVEFSIRLIRIFAAERFAVSSEADIDRQVFRSLLDAKANAMPGIGAFLEKYKQIIAYRDFLSSSYLLALADLPFILLFLVTITLVAGPLVLVAISCGIVLLVASLLTTLPLFDYERTARRAGERRFGLLNDLLTAREAVIGRAMREGLFARWHAASIEAIQASSLARYWRGLGLSITSSLTFIAYVGVLVGGVYMVEAQTLTAGGLLAATMLTARSMGAFASVTTLVVRYQEFRTAMRELNQLFPPTEPTAPAPVRGRLQGSVQLEHITCRLREGTHPVLQDVSLSIQPGEMVGIAGAPGAGKTTLLRLIAGVLSPDAGQVLLDYQPLATLSLEDMTINLGYKPQECALMEGTIEENVRAGRPPLTAGQQQAVLALSGLGVAFQEGGLNWGTPVGTRGQQLSGGQRQLVALARALLHQPPLLLLDEPGNGLDGPLEAHVCQSLQHLKGQATILISAHNRSLLALCDRIIVLGQSRILADGPRDKVMV